MNCQVSVSAIIPAFNAANHVGQAIESVLHQGYEVQEIICINDGSTDNTLEVLEHYQNKYSRKIKLISTPNCGAPAARNNGVSSSSGEYIQFLDADDLLLPDKIMHQVQLIEKTQCKSDVVIGNYYRLNFNGEKKLYSFLEEDTWFALMTSRLGITSSNLWKKETILKINGWNTALKSSQEYDLLFRIMKQEGQFLFDEQPNTIVRDRKSSISQNNLAENWERFCTLRAEIINFIQEILYEDPKRKKFFYQALFDSIRILYKYNSQLASQYYHKFIPSHFSPSVSAATSELYVRLFKIFGFDKTERIKHLFKI